MTISKFIGNLKVSDVIASLALVVASFSIFWNIYKDILLKPRLKVRIQISELIQQGSTQRNSFIDITATNHGPGVITCESIWARKRAFLRRIRPGVAFILPDNTNVLSAQLPKKLAVGDKLTLLLPYNKESVLARKPTHIGISDSFGRVHWADSNSLKQAIKTYLKNFPEEKWGK